ncbi:hypothetical protein E4U09_007506 [Claviceps aff. purpurea]|uniref:SGTA homodimerisation domain-containing protein n=1 Tax=Claviceps aff. purpurea TaxID=1967640 RepID=A0A9P7QEF2_9HYPO|nr:hypothetical protein E4U09_007506 [Claviceps aff. purpurea]
MGPKAQMRTLKKQKASGASDLKNQGRQPVEATICHLKLVEGSTRTTPNFQVVERLHFLPEPGSGTPPLAFPGPEPSSSAIRGAALPTASRPTKLRRRTPSCASEPRFNLSEAPASQHTSKQRLALAICDFLSTSATDGTLTAEDKDSVDVAVNCIAECFKVDANDKEAVKAAVGSQSLLSIYSVYEKLKASTTGGSASASGSASGSSAPAAGELSDEQKKEAEGLKSKGNAAMAQKDYPVAIDFYTQALKIHPSNAVFLSNRAAAHSAAKDHASARTDAEAAVAVDPSYTKAWSRLGLARFAMGDAKGAMEAYSQGIEHEGNGGSEAMKKGYETAKRRVDEMQADGVSLPRSSPGAGGMPDLSSLASMFGGGGAGGAGGGGAGGMPDLGSIMSNPMFASMAQNLMSNPDLMSNLMSNPGLRDMASQFSSGGGMPDLSSLMSDPTIADMARNMMGGGGGAPGGAPGSNQNNQGQ